MFHNSINDLLYTGGKLEKLCKCYSKLYISPMLAKASLSVLENARSALDQKGLDYW